MVTAMADTIFALSSGSLPSGVAMVRVSGRQASGCAGLVEGGLPVARKAAYRILRDPRDGRMIDRGVVVHFPGPSSYTGEDVVEFSIHGGRAGVAALMAALGGLEGFRVAEPGEFTRRALENGKIDLTQAEGLSDLLSAETEMQRRQAIELSEGQAGRQVERWRSEIVRMSAMVEASIDFSDEDDVEDADLEIYPDRCRIAG